MTTKANSKKNKRLNARVELRKSSLPRNCQWQFDFDYLDELGPEDAKWMNQFVREYYHANMSPNGADELHKTPEAKRDCYGRKNRQNRDLLSILDSGGKITRIDKPNYNFEGIESWNPPTEEEE